MGIDKKIKAGDVRAASRLIRDIEDSIPEAKATIKSIFPLTGKAQGWVLPVLQEWGKAPLLMVLLRQAAKRKGLSVFLPLILRAPLQEGNARRQDPHAAAC